MHLFHRESTWDRITRPTSKVDSGQAARTGLTAGAAVLAVTIASAVTSAVRRRQEPG